MTAISTPPSVRDSAVGPLSVRDGYDRWAPGYDAYDNPLVRIEEPVVRAMVGDVQGRRVLDVGCGTGRHAIVLAQAGASVTGVDGSPGMLAALRAKSALVHTIEHDVHGGLPVADAAFDVVICCLVLEHVHPLAPAFAELARVCAPGGRVVVSDLHPEQTRRGVHARFRDASGTKHQIVGHHHSIADYVNAALASGLGIELVHEQIMDERVAEGSASAQKYVGESLLFAMRLRR